MPQKRPRQKSMEAFFFSKRKRTADTKTPEAATAPSPADLLAGRLKTKPVYLTADRASWYIHTPQWMPSTRNQFQEEWNLHPSGRHPLKLFGKVVYEKRWSQSWGFSYHYSGSTNTGRSVEESTLIPVLIQRANELTETLLYNPEKESSPYNGCLQNWYRPDDTIGLHSDDEKELRVDLPIFSLSWGGTRRFLLRSKDTKEKTEVWLRDGDLLIMGGTCQTTHKHEVPKLRSTMDPPTSDRINWTIRAFRRAKDGKVVG